MFSFQKKKENAVTTYVHTDVSGKTTASNTHMPILVCPEFYFLRQEN